MKRVSFGVLKNGFRFYTQFDDRAHVSSIGVRVGSNYDPKERGGMSHLTEHIAGDFGDKKELRLYELNCMSDDPGINIREDRVSTCYGHDLVYHRDNTLELFRMFADGVKGPEFTEERLKREQAAVLNEYYLRGMDDIETWRVTDLAMEHMYAGCDNPASNRTDCEPDGLRQITVPELQSFYNTYYRASNMFAIMLDSKYERVRRLVEELFGDLPALPEPQRPKARIIRPFFPNVKYVEVERKGIHQYHVVLAFPTNPWGHKDDVAIELMATYLQWQMRQRLRVKNYAWGKGAYRVRTEIESSFLHGMIMAWFATPSKDFAEEGAAMVIEECERLRTGDIQKDDLVQMNNRLYNRYVDDFTTLPGGLAERIIEAVANGDLEARSVNGYRGELAKIGRGAIMRVANEYLTTKNYLHILVKPSDGPIETVTVGERI